MWLHLSGDNERACLAIQDDIEGPEFIEILSIYSWNLLVYHSMENLGDLSVVPCVDDLMQRAVLLDGSASKTLEMAR
ncbi:hypothetical protein DAT35_09785 [Vitiosangium sp. GDMCC 1.1324]|nr:hypothetical protein DAT35_09785 [Vitiosangium sp. GDMCC 1.1324]